MFEPTPSSSSVATLRNMLDALRRLEPDVDDATRIDRIRLLEELKSAAAAAQARETAAFAVSQTAAADRSARSSKHAKRSVTAEVALARRISPWQSARYVGWVAILTSELPNTFAALAGGVISEWRAMLVARETIWLSRQHRAAVDAELAPRLASLGDKRLEAEARKLAYRLDPDGFVTRSRAAENERRVTIRPAPDAMARVSALLPVAQGVACYAALATAADASTNGGDPRGRGQIMADTLVERVAGQASASAVPVEVHLLMTDATLMDTGDPEPGEVLGYGPIPAGVARALVLEAADDVPVWLRRLYTAPRTGELVAMERNRRAFGAGQRRFIRDRDRYCRTPYCEAPIRHADHLKPAEAGGSTNVANGRGTCEACNYAKQAPGWSTRLLPDGAGHEVEITTPTGHRYRSRPPDPPDRTRASPAAPRGTRSGKPACHRRWPRHVRLGAAAIPDRLRPSA